MQVSKCQDLGNFELSPMGPVPNFCGHWSRKYFLRQFIFQDPATDSRRVLSVTSESMCTNYWLTA